MIEFGGKMMPTDQFGPIYAFKYVGIDPPDGPFEPAGRFAYVGPLVTGTARLYVSRLTNMKFVEDTY